MRLDDSGSHHDGAFLDVSVTKLDHETTLLHATLECRKNWSGYRSAVAYIGIIDKAGVYKDEWMPSCSAHGPGDGGTTRKVKEHRFVLANRPYNKLVADVFILSRLESVSKDWTEDTLEQIRDAIKEALKKVGGEAIAGWMEGDTTWDQMETALKTKGFRVARLPA